MASFLGGRGHAIVCRAVPHNRVCVVRRDGAVTQRRLVHFLLKLLPFLMTLWRHYAAPRGSASLRRGPPRRPLFLHRAKRPDDSFVCIKNLIISKFNAASGGLSCRRAGQDKKRAARRPPFLVSGAVFTALSRRQRRHGRYTCRCPLRRQPGRRPYCQCSRSTPGRLRR